MKPASSTVSHRSCATIVSSSATRMTGCAMLSTPAGAFNPDPTTLVTPIRFRVESANAAKTGGETGIVAGCQQLRLLDPVIAADASLEPPELHIEPVDVRLAPIRDLLEAGDTERGKLSRQLGADSLEPREIVARNVAGRRRRLDSDLNCLA